MKYGAVDNHDNDADDVEQDAAIRMRMIAFSRTVIILILMMMLTIAVVMATVIMIMLMMITMNITTAISTIYNCRANNHDDPCSLQLQHQLQQSEKPSNPSNCLRNRRNVRVHHPHHPHRPLAALGPHSDQSNRQNPGQRIVMASYTRAKYGQVYFFVVGKWHARKLHSTFFL